MFNPTTLRTDRQQAHYKALTESLISGDTNWDLINIKALNRFLSFKGMTETELFADCLFNSSLSSAIAFAICKNATRQGLKDEAIVLNHINSHSSHKVENLSVNSKRYHNIDKSVDGEFNGLYNGDIFAKIIVGKGGHQDNVWIELKSILTAAQQLDPKRIYCLLVDTDDVKRFNQLKQQETGNVWVCNTQQLIERLS